MTVKCISRTQGCIVSTSEARSDPTATNSWHFSVLARLLKKRCVADMELTSQELDLLYGLTRFESISLRQGDYTKQPEEGSYADAIYKLDTKLTADFHKRNQTIK
jgi:hypothetical protein